MPDATDPTDPTFAATERRETTHPGSCHCRAVRFEVDVDLGAGVGRCNCTFCTKLMLTGVIVRPDKVRFVAGEALAASYRPGAISTRWFCRTCGVHLFGRGHLAELGGDYASINVNALDDVDPSTLPTTHWDGRHDNWDAGPRPAAWPIFA